MRYEPLRELRVTEPARLRDVVWFHDADFDADAIVFDAGARVVQVPFQQDVRQLPSDLPFPRPVNARRRWFGVEMLLPYVECRFTARHAVGVSVEGDMTWGLLGDATFEQGRMLVLHPVFGPTIRIEIADFDVAVSASDQVRWYKRLRAGPFGEGIGGRINPAAVRGPAHPLG